MSRTIFILILLAILLYSCENQYALLQSPGGKMELSIAVDKDRGLSYSVYMEGDLISGPSCMGFKLDDGQRMGGDVRILGIRQELRDISWIPVYGEQSSYRDHHRMMEITLWDRVLETEFSIQARAYEEGVAFRYIFPEELDISVTGELTSFGLPLGSKLWTSYRAQAQVLVHKLSDVSDLCDRPLLIETPDSCYMAIGEAALMDFPRMKFGKIKGDLPHLVASLDGNVECEAGLRSPWRYIMAGSTPANVLQNNGFILNLNTPNQLEDVSWIRPGKVIREVTLTTQGGMACVDFAADHGLDYIEFDDGWYGDIHSPDSDARTVSPDPEQFPGGLDLQRVIAYAESKGIGVLLFVTMRAMEGQMDQILPLYSDWGVAGIKVAYLSEGSRDRTVWINELVRKCAGFGLMVALHDEYRPTGISRTWPNLMTAEGVRSDEYGPDNVTVIRSVFTRGIAGATDQAMCYFAERVSSTMGNHVSQMAKSICIYSPWQFLYWYDRPQGSPGGTMSNGSDAVIPEIQDLDFFASLPVVWDEYRILEGYPGEFVLVARRKGRTWYLGALNGSSSRQYSIDLDFLEEGQSYSASIYSHDPSLRTRTNVRRSEIPVERNSVISRYVDRESGLAIVIRPIEDVIR